MAVFRSSIRLGQPAFSFASASDQEMAGFAPRLLDGAETLVGQLFVVIRSSIQLGHDRVLGTPKQNRRGGQRFVGESIYETM